MCVCGGGLRVRALLQIFDFEDPDLAASLSHNFSMARVKPELREAVEAEYLKESSSITGAHIDGPPFVALLVNDRPGLQVIGAEGKWIDAPVTCRTAPVRGGKRPCFVPSLS